MNRGSDCAFPLDRPTNPRQLGMTIREHALVHVAAGFAAGGLRNVPVLIDRTIETVDRLLAAFDALEEEP